MRQHFLVDLDNADRISKKRVSLAVELADQRMATALIAVEKLAATARFVTCRVDSAVPATVVQADNSLLMYERKSVVHSLEAESEM